MRISLNWLRELVEVTLTPEELAQTLTMAGFEVEDIEDLGTLADGVVIGKVLEVEPHPNANKLRVCQVDIGGSDPLNIVCGASNVRPDIYVPVATIGTYLPTIDLKIRASKLRGVRSEGMICSLAEVGLAKESAGIHIFEAETIPLGSDARPLLGLTDIILDVTSTANRADALSMVGVAREVVALTGASLSLPETVEVSIPEASHALTLKVSEPKACPAYIGTVIEGVKIGPSPDWLQQRLKAAGVRPINNVVDVTNYILLEWGQPLHAFDRERLQAVAGVENLTIGVRFANSGESLTTLDGQTRSLEPQALLITANDQPVAMAGVMGGEATEVNDNTQTIVLEAALFDPVTIRRSSRSQSIRTESSARYERGVNQAELDIACKRAIALITELAAGTPTTQSIADQRPDPSTWARSIELRLDRVNQILGPVNEAEELGEILPEDVERILTALGCQLQPRCTEDSPQWKVIVPPYRYRDLEREIDLIEEIARLYGYDNFCDSLPDKTEPGYLSAEEFLKRKLRSQFRAVGLTELVQYSLVKPEEQTQIRLDNPLFTEYSSLRTDLLSGLIDACQYNIEQGNGVLNGFEIGRIFWRPEEGFAEADAIAGILGGNITQGNWVRGGHSEPMTWYEAKGVLESVFSRCGLTVEYQPDHSDPRLHPGRTASLWLQGEKLGKFGQLHPQLRSERGFPDQVYVFDLDLDLILEALDRDEILTPRFKVYSSYPAIDRDIAFFAPLQVSVAEIERSTRKAAGNLLESVQLFDEYKGESVPEAQRSLAFRLIYRASDRTLTDAEVEPVHQKVREALEETFGVSLRS
ncbi:MULTISPECIES: phenylalanine--tRNA ligase subunit beta [Moorena]|uniref:Phenylalanine--tRNA ligase beta subunit n=1 Tax=Moorena producens 3L TaxID=489825 RepID=F4XXH1_9CYAN|nr:MULTISPECIES: phenylalanine--tRNA ligase subunit beta [Moorena]NEQ13444.1 phenylalanine--tRNA ligase subunit beta [Moorena sp. SIO3E2]EGJ30649.1 phenylalanyl-tRNA synthetase beta subunit [Moorena producens 3L]NEP33033.1 phenylalanine--tRNA ligase subunit beta [Moorena sp. SIO3B2]NEP64596.1 phenylalanine--tRNA ligase subunit beta [Moorena sp. SIO3A5]NER90799.1 phenylalanine--tRNA ligase subunit beta [Moorena sp. SIO3A2]